MQKFLVVGLFLAAAFLIIFLNKDFFEEKITGRGTEYNETGFQVTIGSGSDAILRLFLNNTEMDLGETQRIETEIINTGSKLETTSIQLFIYSYNNTLNLNAFFFDSTVALAPGNIRTFNINFQPQTYGIYFVQARVILNDKTVETWAAFIVFIKYADVPPPPPPPVTIPRVLPPPPIDYGIPRATVEHPDSIRVAPGTKALFPIRINNTGEVPLNNIRLFISTSNLINFTMAPKVIPRLEINQSSTFLVTIDIPENTPLGRYPFDFNVEMNEITIDRHPYIDVNLTRATQEDEIRQRILSYSIIIRDIEQDIFQAETRGVDTSRAKDSLNRAKEGLDRARSYLNSNLLQDASDELDRVKDALESAVYELANAGIQAYGIFRPPAFNPFLIIIIITISPIIPIIFVLYRRKKKKEKENERPKLLRQMSESGEEPPPESEAESKEKQ